MRDALKKLLRLFLGDYSIYRIYSYSLEDGPVHVSELPTFRFSRVGRAEIEASDDPLIREQAWYGGNGSHAFAYLEESRIVSLCFFWYGDRYRTRNFWPLAKDEAKLVQVVTLEEKRGSGIATALIANASAILLADDFVRLYARIWHSNLPSLRAFRRASWHPVATVIELNPLRQKVPPRLTFRAKR